MDGDRNAQRVALKEYGPAEREGGIPAMHVLIKVLTTVFDAQAKERHDLGATATEYAILVAFIALVIVVGIALFGTQLNAYWEQIAGTVAGFF
jgi:pilus assembly protein Flp/PilA